MKSAPKVALTIALVSILSTPAQVQFAACAQTLPNGTATANVAVSPAADVRMTVDMRLGQLEDRIKTAQTEGRLSQEEADNFRSAVAQISEAEATYLASAATLGPAMAARLFTALDRLERRFTAALHDRRIASIDLASQESLLQQLIDQALADGRLQQAEAAQLQNELKAVRDREASLRTDGHISYGDSLVISMQLDRVMDHLARVRTQPVLSAPSVESLANQVSTLLASGKVPADQVPGLRKQFDDLTAQSNKLKDITNASLKAQQELFLAAEFEQMLNRVQLAEAGKVVAIDPKERASQIDFAIADALVSGKLSPAEAHELAAELQGVRTEMGTAQLTDDKTRRIALELERIAGHTNRWVHTPGRNWPGLDAFQAAFDHRLEEAVRANRITAEQSTQLKVAADAVAKEETDRRASNNRIDTAEALDLSMRIQRLAVQLHQEMKDRDVAAPDVDALQKELDRVIAEGIDSGRIRGASHWTNRLGDIATLRQAYESSPTGLDGRAKLAIAQRVAAAIADAQATMRRDQAFNSSLDLRLDQLGDQLSNAVATGLLTVERGAQYRAGIDTIYKQLQNYRKSDNGLTANEAIALSSDTNLIANQLQAELHDNALFASDIAQWLEDLEVKIGRGVANGRLTVSQANALMLEVDRKSAALNTAAGAQGGLSHGEALKLAYDVQRLNSRFETQLHNEPVPITDVAHRAMQIDATLANALAAGQLSVPEAQQYKSRLENILSSSAMYRSTDLGLSYPEALALSIELDELGYVVEHGLHKETATRDVDSREADLQRRIKAMVSSGKLSQKDADNLANDLDRIEASEAAFRVSDEGLNYAEALTLTLDLDRLAARLDGFAKLTMQQKPQPTK